MYYIEEWSRNTGLFKVLMKKNLDLLKKKLISFCKKIPGKYASLFRF